VIPEDATMILLFPFLAFLLFSIPAAGTSMLCSIDLYGKPSPADSEMVAKALPFAKDDTDSQMDAGHIFAEPAFFKPRFSALKNKWPTKME